jgi:hypothetical protein
MNEILESKMILRNFVYFTTGVPSSLLSGSKWCLRLLQKYTHTVLSKRVCVCPSLKFVLAGL